MSGGERERDNKRAAAAQHHSPNITSRATTQQHATHHTTINIQPGVVLRHHYQFGNQQQIIQLDRTVESECCITPNFVRVKVQWC